MTFARLMVLLLLAASASTAAIRLFLADGGELIVDEYEVLEDRVRYYSTERSAWEEIPLDLVDLERTRKLEQRNRRRLETMKAESSVERAAERRARTELHNVPLADGVYYWDGTSASSLQQAVVVTDESASRKFLQILSPAPVVAGKTDLAIEKAHAEFAAGESKPQFFVRLAKMFNLNIVRVKSQRKKERRIVQTIQKAPTTGEMFEEQEEIEIFRQQLAPNVYKIWPVKPLEPGEYAIVDFTPGQQNLRVWDFAVRETAP